MGERVSKTQMDRLGERLRVVPPASDDLERLQVVIGGFAAPLAECVEVLRRLELHPSFRLKTRDTTLAKLARQPTTRLSQVQDLAGARIVRGMTLAEQDDLVATISSEFDEVEVKDRRTLPVFGYRAVHLIVRADGLPVEIQVRTSLQDEWAQLFEALADRWGRGIRYGEAPMHPDEPFGPSTRAAFVALLIQIGEEGQENEEAVGGLVPHPNTLDELLTHGELETAQGRLWASIERMAEVYRSLRESLQRGTMGPS